MYWASTLNEEIPSPNINTFLAASTKSAVQYLPEDREIHQEYFQRTGLRLCVTNS